MAGCRIKVSAAGRTSSYPLNHPGWSKAYAKARELAAEHERAQVELYCKGGLVDVYSCFNDRMGKGCSIDAVGGGDPERFPSIAGVRRRRRR